MADATKSKDASGYLRNPQFNLASYKETQKQTRGLRQSAPHELKTWPYYKDSWGGLTVLQWLNSKRCMWASSKCINLEDCHCLEGCMCIFFEGTETACSILV